MSETNIDKAQEETEIQLQHTINNARTVQKKIIHNDCSECGDPLNDFRKKNYYSTCVDCQEELEGAK